MWGGTATRHPAAGPPLFQHPPEDLLVLVGDPVPVVQLTGARLCRGTKLPHPRGIGQKTSEKSGQITHIVAEEGKTGLADRVQVLPDAVDDDAAPASHG